MCWKRSPIANGKCLSNDSDLSTDIAGPMRKWAASAKSLASAFARSKRRPCAKCGIQHGFGSSKVSLRRREFEHIFSIAFERNFEACRLLNRMDNMEPQDDKELWDVLGRLPEPTLSPFFARNVLRKIRQEPTHFERLRNWFSVRKVVGMSAVAAVFVALALVTHYQGPRTTSSNDSDVVAKIDPQDYDVVADLD